MRKQIRNFVREAVTAFVPLEPVYEFGSYLIPGQEKLANLRPLFPGKEYVGTDYRTGPGVDKVLDLQEIALPPESVGTALILDTLEHVENPWRAMEEIHRVLKPGGLVVISSVMFFPIHDHPFDYWRFTPEAFRSLLKRFKTRMVFSSGLRNFPDTVVGIGCKASLEEARLAEFEAGIKRRKVLAGGWKEAVLGIIPPVLSFPLYRRMTNRSSQ